MSLAHAQREGASARLSETPDGTGQSCHDDDLFNQFTKQKRRRSLAIIYVLGCTVSPFFFFLDYYIVGGHFWLLLTIRILVSTISIVMFLIIYKRWQRWMWIVDGFGSFPILLVSIQISIVMYYSGGSTSPYAMAQMMMIIVSGLYVYCTRVEGFVLTLGIAALHSIPSLLAPGPLNWKVFISSSSFLYTLSFMTYHALWLQRRLEKETFTANRQIEEKNAQLEQLDKAKTRFFSNMTHEFRTPLVALSSTVQMILDHALDSPILQKKLLLNGKESLEDMLENVNDLLTKTRSEQGMLEMRWGEMDMVAFAERACALFEPMARVRGNRLVFTNRLACHSERLQATRGGVEESLSTQNRDPSTRPEASLRMTDENSLCIYADRAKLKKIFNNLVGNALKFTKDGEVEVILETGRDPSAAPRDDKQGTSREDDKQHTSRDDKKDDVCILQVRDTGIGIPQEEIATLFDPFTQASNNPLREVQGTGIGLSMVKDLVALHDGHVTVESELGKGSVFTVTLPIGDAHVDWDKLDTSFLVEDSDDAQRVNFGIKSFDDVDFTPFDHRDAEKHTVLLVEDNPQIIQVLAYVLAPHYNLYFAKNGREGVDKAREVNPDLLISDIMMPSMNGYELVQVMKGDPVLRHIPIILLTSRADLDAKLKGFEEGADEYLSKPFHNREILVRVKGLIERRKMEEERFQGLATLLAATKGTKVEGLSPFSS